MDEGAIELAENDARERWLAHQLSKSRLFHQKLHEWGMLEVAQQIESVDGEKLDWDKSLLGITEQAWNRIIHRGIRPVQVFANSAVLTSISRAVAYYRMLAMVSQKSMSNVRLSVKRYEDGGAMPKQEAALLLARHLNSIISALIEADEEIDAREFDIWRGMGAGAQAQGSSQNSIGKQAEAIIQSLIRQRLRDYSLAQAGISEGSKRIVLTDGRYIEFRGDPDVAVYRHDGKVQAIVEVKGGIDPAAALERLGAMLKSFGHAREASEGFATILVLQEVSVTKRTRSTLQSNTQVDYWFTVDELSQAGEPQMEFFTALGI